MVGIDARLGFDVGPFKASSVAIDAAGKRILTGGDVENGIGTGAKLWDLKTKQKCNESSRTGPGPVAFRADDDTPLQLTVHSREPLSLALWDVAADKLVCDFKLPVEPNAARASHLRTIRSWSLLQMEPMRERAYRYPAKKTSCMSGT